MELFSKKKKGLIIIWGTSGIRRIFASFGDEYRNFTPKVALKIGLAIGSYVNGGTVVVGRDIRTTAVPIELALTSGLVSAGCTVKTIGMVTTPTLAMSMKFLDGDCGVMITASHNTPEYIGIKLWNPSGLGFKPEQEIAIEEIYNNKSFNRVSWDKVGSVTSIYDINSLHVNEIMKLIDLKNGKKEKLNVIIDPGNGSSCEIAPLLLQKLDCKFITLNSQPDGHFPGRLSEPSSKNLQTLISFIKVDPDLDFGIALDGDADRVIFIDGNGELLEPIRLLTFLAKHELEKKPIINGHTPKIVTPINSSSVIEEVLKPLGCEIIKTQVGDIKVAIEIQNQNGYIGGENCGTYIYPEFHFGPDSLVTIAKVVEILSYEDKSFTELLKEIPEFPYTKEEFDLKEDIPITIENYVEIGKAVEKLLISQGFKKIVKNEIDGMRLDYEDGWVLIRRSGTSPKLRIAGEHKEDVSKVSKLINLIVELLSKDPFNLM